MRFTLVGLVLSMALVRLSPVTAGPMYPYGQQNWHGYPQGAGSSNDASGAPPYTPYAQQNWNGDPQYAGWSAGTFGTQPSMHPFGQQSGYDYQQGAGSSHDVSGGPSSMYLSHDQPAGYPLALQASLPAAHDVSGTPLYMHPSDGQRDPNPFAYQASLPAAHNSAFDPYVGGADMARLPEHTHEASGSSTSILSAYVRKARHEKEEPRVFGWEPPSVSNFDYAVKIPRPEGGGDLYRGNGATEAGLKHIKDLFGPKLIFASEQELLAVTDKDLTNTSPFRRASRVLPIYEVKNPDGTPVLILMTNHGITRMRKLTPSGAGVFETNHYRFWGITHTLEDGERLQLVFYGAAHFDPNDREAIDRVLKRKLPGWSEDEQSWLLEELLSDESLDPPATHDSDHGNAVKRPGPNQSPLGRNWEPPQLALLPRGTKQALHGYTARVYVGTGLNYERQRIGKFFGEMLRWASPKDVHDLGKKRIRNMWPYRRTSRVLPLDGAKSPDGSELAIHMTDHGNTARTKRLPEGENILDSYHWLFWGVPKVLKKGENNVVLLYGAATFDPSNREVINQHLENLLGHASEAAGHAHP